MKTEWMRVVSGNLLLYNNTQKRQIIQGIEQVVSFLSKKVTRRFNEFDKNIVIDWNKVTTGSFNLDR